MGEQQVVGYHGRLLIERTLAFRVELCPRLQLIGKFRIALFQHIEGYTLRVVAGAKGDNTQWVFLPVALQTELRQGKEVGLFLRQSATCGV